VGRDHVSLAFGLVTPPYGLCLLISCAIGRIKVIDCIRDVAVLLIAMLLMLAFVIFFPNVILFFPRLIMPKFV
jgi:TRAP-type C4-dicarboxylate transport system permease large subunit